MLILLTGKVIIGDTVPALFVYLLYNVHALIGKIMILFATAILKAFSL